MFGAMKSLEGRKAVQRPLGPLSQGEPPGGVRALSAQSKTEEQGSNFGGQGADQGPQKERVAGDESQSRVLGQQNTRPLATKADPCTPQTRYKKYLLSVTCTKDKTEPQM